MNSICYGSNYSYEYNNSNTVSFNGENGYNNGAAATAGAMTQKDYSEPLHVDCSVEYDLPNQPNPPKKSEPLLMIHPSYYRRAESQSYTYFTNNMPNTMTTFHAYGIPQEVTNAVTVQAPPAGPPGPVMNSQQLCTQTQQNNLQLCPQNKSVWNTGGGLAQTLAYRGNRRAQGPYRCPDRTLQTHNTLQVHNSIRNTLQTQNTSQLHNILQTQSCTTGYSSGSDSGVSGHWTDTDRSPLAPELRLNRDFPAQPDSGLGTPVSEDLRYSLYDKNNVSSTELMNVCDRGPLGTLRPVQQNPASRCLCCGATEMPPNRPAKRPCGESRASASVMTWQLFSSPAGAVAPTHHCQQRATNAQSRFISPPHQAGNGNPQQLKTSTNQSHSNMEAAMMKVHKHRIMGTAENSCKMNVDMSLQMIPGFSKQWSLEVNNANLWSNHTQTSSATRKDPTYCSSMCSMCNNTPLNVDNLGNNSSALVSHSGDYQLSHYYAHGNCRSFSGDANLALWNKENMLRLFQV